MKNLYESYFQKVLLFGLLFFSCFLTFAQTLDDPTGLPPDQIVEFQELIELTGSCQDGAELKWYDGAVTTTPLVNLTISIEETKTYTAICESDCGCFSNAIDVTFTVNRPINVTRSQSICGTSIELKATCPAGVVTWYETTTDNPIGANTTVQPITETTYLVTCVVSADSYESPTEEVIIYVPDNDPLTVPDPPVVPLTACLGGSVTLTATCAAGTPIFYMSDSITEISALVTNSPLSATYLARCESNLDCPSGFTAIEVTASAPPTPTGISSPDPICIGESVSLSAGCGSDADPAWYLDNETTSVFDVSNLTPSITTTYKVRCESNVFTDCFGTFESVTVTVNNDIVTQPASVLACLGDKAFFALVANGTPDFQWQKRQANGTFVDIPSATNDTLRINNITLADRGYYRCHVTGDCDTYTEEVFLTFPQTITDKGKLIPPQVTTLDEFGNALALSDSLAVVGAISKTSDKGAAYIFKMSPNGKWAQVAQLAPSDLTTGSRFGSAMAISGDTVFVSAVGQTGNEGAVYLFRKLSNNTWSQISKLKLPVAFGGPGSGDYFGASIAVSNNFMAIGADGIESVYTYLRNNTTGVWEPVEELADGSGGTAFGYAVDISGKTLVVGDPYEGVSGAIFIYHRDDDGVSYLDGVYTPDDLDAGVDFGQAVAISGGSIIASTFDQSNGEGEAFIYEKDVAGNWSFKTKLVSYDLTDNAAYGYTVDINDNLAVVGAYANDFGKGAAVVFEKNAGGDWVQKSVLIPTNVQLGDQFGTAVGISKTTILSTELFDPLTPTLTPLKGAAYFYGIYTYPAATVETVVQAAAVCSGQKAIFNLTGLLSTDSYTITYKIDEGGDLKTVVITPDAEGKASFTQTLVWENNTKSIFITKVKNDVTGCETNLDVSSEIMVKAPTIITRDPARQIVCIGETAVFMGEATGEGILNFQWQRLAPNSSGVNTPLGNDFSDISVLTLANRTMADNGAKYKVKVTGECGVVTSGEALLTVLEKASAIITAGPSVCPGASGLIYFGGTPFANVTYSSNGVTGSVVLSADGYATVSVGPINSETTFSLVSIDIEGKCNRPISGSAVIGILPSGTVVVPPLVLTSPDDNVATSIIQTRTAQSLMVSNKISSGGKATHTGNKYIILGEGFESASGSVYVAAITPACP